MRRRGTPRRAAALVLTTLVGAAAIAGCGDGGDLRPALEIDASTYVAAIEGFLPPPDVSGELAVVYVVPVADESLALDTQVAVIDALSDEYDVRFVDQHAAAIDNESVDDPPRDDGTLIGLGTVTPDAPHTVRVEVYEDRDEVEGHLLTMAVQRGSWVVLSDETVEPEVLVGGE